ncbi:MAG: cobaltochelatase subunit CobN, partial [Abditibacteriales bacterium]|nr:cobaltochelatase subunit CobN [Abditibacteriales bacterium]MDW8365569.1 cobaltochelatase subunit CobN [Abditibacteriales bacterium]
SSLRIFAPPAGVYGAIEQAAPKAKDPSKLAHLYMERLGFAYGHEATWGTQQRQVFEELLKGAEVAVFSRTGRLYGLLDTDHPFAWLGGMSLAIKQLSGKAPQLVIANMQSNLPEQARMESAQRFLSREALSRYLHPAWLKGMMAHNFAGAREMSNWLAHLGGWQLTAPEVVDENLWQQAYEVYVRDQFRLGLVDWLRRVNPEALQAIAKSLLQAAERGAWNAPSTAFAELIALGEGRKPTNQPVPTIRLASQTLPAPSQPEAARRPARATRSARPNPPPSARSPRPNVDQLVSGIKLSEVTSSAPVSIPLPSLPLTVPLLGFTLFIAGVHRGLKRGEWRAVDGVRR